MVAVCFTLVAAFLFSSQISATSVEVNTATKAHISGDQINARTAAGHAPKILQLASRFEDLVYTDDPIPEIYQAWEPIDNDFVRLYAPTGRVGDETMTHFDYLPNDEYRSRFALAWMTEWLFWAEWRDNGAVNQIFGVAEGAANAESVNSWAWSLRYMLDSWTRMIRDLEEAGVDRGVFAAGIDRARHQARLELGDMLGIRALELVEDNEETIGQIVELVRRIDETPLTDNIGALTVVTEAHEFIAANYRSDADYEMVIGLMGVHTIACTIWAT